MKRVKPIHTLRLIFLIGLASCFFVTCFAPKSAGLTQNQVSISFTDVNFGGDWSAYRAIGVNVFHLVTNTVPGAGNTPVNIPKAISYDANNRPSVSINADYNYILESDTYPTTRLGIKTDFKINQTVHNSLDEEVTLENRTDNNIALSYNFDTEPAVDIQIEHNGVITDDINTVQIVSDAYNYNANWEYVHKATHDNGNIDSNINLLVVAEGYRADQLDYFRSYVEYAFQNAATCHYRDTTGLVVNELFASFWNRINVIRVDTISPHEGIDVGGKNEDIVQSIFDVGRERIIPDFVRIKEMIKQTRPAGLRLKDVDAVILFVNDPLIWCWSVTYGAQLGAKRTQPIHPVLIQAPIGSYEATSNIPDIGRVKVDTIVHELGHAIARLKDEYLSEKYCGRHYYEKYRNIDNDTNFKWQWFIDNGYRDPDLKDNSVTSPQGGFYCPTGYWRPTPNSTMRHGGDNVQFGPVNTYHMVASFRLRMGIAVQAKDNGGFEWESYPFEVFKQDWPPEKFKVAP